MRDFQSSTRLTRKEVYVVTTLSEIDGFAYSVAYFSSKEAAIAKAKSVLNGNWHQNHVWEDQDGTLWSIRDATEVHIDLPNKSDILAKLTPAERHVLGVS